MKLKKIFVFLIINTNRLIRSMRPYFLYGNRVKCVLCGWSFRRFLPSGILEREFWRGTEGREIRKLPHVTICNAKCPKCGSSERQRLFYIYMKTKKDFDKEKNIKILEVGPDDFVTKALFDRPDIEYTSVDIERSNATQKMDLTNLNYPDGSFDNIFCYHVLEHINDDIKAMMELYRVLKPGGWGILQVPLWSDLTFEDPKVSPEEYELIYGHPQHVRRYGKDYLGRLESVGFKVDLDKYSTSLTNDFIEKYGILKSEDIYLCKKSK